ncbi:MAG TPA: hypothetical protein VFV99_27965 [Kofleriaceae bacterium]|nr:hypothetical protein [Kofleriaceae bacterium]
MRRLLLIAFVGCGDGSSSTVDAPRTDPAVCKANLESSIDRTCTMASDCVLVASADCCGTIMIAVHAGTQGMFPTVEQTYEACLACPPLGCNHADQAEDGSVPQSGQAIVATCTANRCVSVVQ